MSREPTKLPAEHCLLQFRTTVDGPTHHYQGWVRVAIYDSGIYMQWEGEYDWYGVTWWELAHFAHATPPKLREDLQMEREKARDKAFSDGLVDVIADCTLHPELYKKAFSLAVERGVTEAKRNLPQRTSKGL